MSHLLPETKYEFSAFFFNNSIRNQVTTFVYLLSFACDKWDKLQARYQWKLHNIKYRSLLFHSFLNMCNLFVSHVSICI